MTIDVAAPTTTKPEAKPASQKQSAQPQITLTVPAKPAAVTAANVATLAGTAAAAAGPVGWAVTATAAAAGGAYLVARRVVRRGRQRRRNGPFGPAPTGASLGRFGGAPAGRLKSGLGRRIGSTIGGSGAARAADRRGALSAGLARHLRGNGGRGSKGGVASPGSRRASSRIPGTLSRLGRRVGAVGRAAGKLGTKGAQSAGNGRTKKQRTPVTSGTSGAGSGLWRYARRLVRRRVLGKPGPEQVRKAPPKSGPQPPRKTGASIRRSPQPTAGPESRSRGPVPKPKPHHVSTTGGTMSGNSTPQPTSVFWHAARQLHAAAAKFKPRGMIEVRTECYELPQALAEISGALRKRAEECTKQPLDPKLAAAIMQIAACVDTAAHSSRTLGDAFDGLHPTEVRRILRPRANEGAWDTTNNR